MKQKIYQREPFYVSQQREKDVGVEIWSIMKFFADSEFYNYEVGSA